MKRIIRWICRPVLAGFDARVVRLVGVAVEARMIPPLLESLATSDARLERIETLLVGAERSSSKMAEEVDLVLNGLSREIFRLQAQVELLRRDQAQEGEPMAGGLSILPESSNERSRVG